MKYGGYPLDLRCEEDPGQLKIIRPDGQVITPDHYFKSFQQVPVEERNYYQLLKDEKIFKKEHGYIWRV